MAGEIPSREELQKALLSRCTREEVEKESIFFVSNKCSDGFPILLPAIFFCWC